MEFLNIVCVHKLYTCECKARVYCWCQSLKQSLPSFLPVRQSGGAPSHSGCVSGVEGSVPACNKRNANCCWSGLVTDGARGRGSGRCGGWGGARAFTWSYTFPWFIGTYQLLSQLQSKLLESHGKTGLDIKRFKDEGICDGHINQEPKCVLVVLGALQTDVVITSQLIFQINTPIYRLYSATLKILIQYVLNYLNHNHNLHSCLSHHCVLLCGHQSPLSEVSITSVMLILMLLAMVD